MSHPQLYPLEVNSTTGEPFLRLSAPLQNIIITPARLSDAPHFVRNLNDPAIVSKLFSPPYPYLHSHAEWWLAHTTQSSDALLKELRAADPQGPLITVRGCPVEYIREVLEDGTDIFIGNIDMHPCTFPGESEEVRKQLSDENTRRAVGDPGIIWCIGYWLAASHHGRGIMSAAVRTLIQSWAISRMGARQFRVEAFQGNTASVRVFEKMGFQVEKIVDEEVKTSSGSVWPGHVILWWRQE